MALNMEVTPELAAFLETVPADQSMKDRPLAVQAALTVLRLHARIAEIEGELATRTRQRDIALDVVKAIIHHNCRDIAHRAGNRKPRDGQDQEDLARMSHDPDRNARVQARYDELMQVGRHGHYETIFQIVKEEVERERAKWVRRPNPVR